MINSNYLTKLMIVNFHKIIYTKMTIKTVNFQIKKANYLNRNSQIFRIFKNFQIKKVNTIIKIMNFQIKNHNLMNFHKIIYFTIKKIMNTQAKLILLSLTIKILQTQINLNFLIKKIISKNNIHSIRKKMNSQTKKINIYLKKMSSQIKMC